MSIAVMAGGASEVALILWLLIVGVNMEQWRKQEQVFSGQPGGVS